MWLRPSAILFSYADVLLESEATKRTCGIRKKKKKKCVKTHIFVVSLLKCEEQIKLKWYYYQSFDLGKSAVWHIFKLD